jgi:hypothetical protein
VEGRAGRAAARLIRLRTWKVQTRAAHQARWSSMKLEMKK